MAGCVEGRAVPTGLAPIFHFTQGLRPGLTDSAPNAAGALPLTALQLFLQTGTGALKSGLKLNLRANALVGPSKAFRRPCGAFTT